MLLATHLTPSLYRSGGGKDAAPGPTAGGLVELGPNGRLRWVAGQGDGLDV